jgi:Actin
MRSVGCSSTGIFYLSLDLICIQVSGASLSTMSAADKAVAAGGDVGGSSILLNQPIVIDNGTSSVKAGFAGGSKPKVNFDGGIADYS